MLIGDNVDPLFLWILRFKVNTPDGGLNWVLKMPATTEANAKAKAILISKHYRAVMPSTCEIYRATISKSNSTKDSRIVKDAIGDGMYLQSGVGPAATVYNKFDACVKVRFEDEDGSGVTFEIGPVPDTIIQGGEFPLAITSVDDMTAADPADPVQDVVYAAAFRNLMLLVGKYCGRIEAKTNVPGGTYKYSKFKTAHVIGVGRKKGGRVFVK